MDTAALSANEVPDEARQEQKLAMVFRRFNGKATLEPLTVNNTDSGQQIIEKVKAKQREVTAAEGRICCLNLLLTQEEAAIAEIKWVRVNEALIQYRFGAYRNSTDSHGYKT